MKQALAVIVILLAIITVVFLIVLSNQATSQNQNTQKTKISHIEGVVLSSTPTSLTLQQGKSQLIIPITSNTEILDAQGESFELDQVQKNFTVRVEGPTDNPTKIIVLTQPNVIVYSPEKNTIVGQRFIISGVARVFENVVSIKLTSATNNVLVETFVTADAPDIGKYGVFSKEMDLRSLTSVKNGDKLTLTVFQSSAKDGSEIDQVIIPLTVDFKKNLILKAYFTNDMLNHTTDCQVVFPVEREVPYTVATARAALEELLKGPTDQEALKGYGTSLNVGVKIKNITISEGIATVDFTQELQQGVAGSCRVQSIRTQIEETLLQFPTVKSVTILVDGENETVLQP